MRARPGARAAGTVAIGASLALVLGLGLSLGVASSADAEPAVALAAGEDHSCAVTASGSVQCWGSNASGQLGDGTLQWSNAPSPVSGLSLHGAAVAAGNNSRHTCALTDTGAVKCWGDNTDGQVGDGTAGNVRDRPVQVSGLTSDGVALAVGYEHTCALTSTGGVRCWGWNAYGQLGDGTYTTRTTPVDVAGLTSGVAAIAAGSFHTCAALTAGGVKCWGDGSAGQIGTEGAGHTENVPIAVTGLPGAASSLAAGSAHTCALISGGSVWCWGDNSVGQLGIEPPTTFVPPVQVSGLASGATAIAAGSLHTCAVTAAGVVTCWGHGDQGQLGDGAATDHYVPIAVAGLGGATAIAAGSAHTCAVAGDQIRCWGRNIYGQLGNGVSAWNGGAPVAVLGLSVPVASVAASARHSCALGAGGGVECWGYNGHGQLGNGTFTPSLTPVPVTSLSSGVASIDAGYLHTCARMTAGGVKCWGYGGYGQLGNGQFVSQQSLPVSVSGLSTAVSIGAGEYHTCAVLTDGSARCWGRGDYGQLGNGGNNHSSTPGIVSGLTAATGIAGGLLHTCAVRSDGSVRCWGLNSAGALGDGSTTPSNVPVAVTGLSGPVVKVVAGDGYTCALTAAGGVECWGHNGLHNLGNGTVERSLVPVPVPGLSSGIVDLAAGVRHTCAVASSGGVTCWGWNDQGELGDGTTRIRGFPVAVVGLSTGAVGVSASEDHTCVAMASGGAYCWGRPDDGELGGGTPLFSSTPVSVLELEIPAVPALAPLASVLLAMGLLSAAALVSRRALL